MYLVLPYVYDMRRFEFLRLLALGSLAALFLALLAFLPWNAPNRSSQEATVLVASPFIYTFNAPGVLNEAPSMEQSTSPYWWLNSGGQFHISNGVGATMQGDAGLFNYWRLQYAKTNPVDTDDGAYPQNLFRLVSRSTWENMRVEAQFKILKDNWSASPNRNASNGLLLMSRYMDGDTVYYAGLRVDGNAVIKKKYRGTYYTLALKKEFAGTYIEGGRTSMLPHQTWVGLRSETITNADESVTIRLFMQRQDGTWKKLLEVRDSGGYGGTPPISGSGYMGIRTDFMDVQIDSIRIENI